MFFLPNHVQMAEDDGLSNSHISRMHQTGKNCIRLGKIAISVREERNILEVFEYYTVYNVLIL